MYIHTYVNTQPCFTIKTVLIPGHKLFTAKSFLGWRNIGYTRAGDRRVRPTEGEVGGVSSPGQPGINVSNSNINETQL